jgi:hypothetical protein
MKKLYYYFYFILFFSTNALAQQISLSDIKIGSKLTDYFTSNEISKYYQDNMEKNAKGEDFWGKDFKYSAVTFYGNEIGDDHDFIQIYYENKTYKIVAISAATADLELNQCIQLRDNKVSKHVAKKLLLNFIKDKDSHTFPDGMKDDFVIFRGIKTNVGFRCYIYGDGDIVYRYSDIEQNYNDWLFKQFNEK